MPQTATNPATGEKVMWDGKAWVPVPKEGVSAAPSASPSPMRQPSYTELMQGPSFMIGRLSEAAGLGIKKLEMGSLKSEAAGNRGTALMQREGANLLRPAESVSRIAGGATSIPSPSVAATGLAIPAAIDVVRPQKKGEDRPARIERGLLGGAQLATLGAAGLGGGGKLQATKYANISAELESFRSMVEKKPTKGNMDVAHTKFSDLTAAVDSMWEPLHQALEKVPVNPTVVEGALKKLRGIRPELDRWVDEMIPTSPTGSSQRAATWGEVKKLNEKLWTLQGKDPVVSSLARSARQELSGALEDTAKAAGLAKDYARAKTLTRKLENVKFHTAYRAIKVADAKWEIGGAFAGALVGEGLGPAGMLGGMYAGHHLGRALGKRFATEPTYKVPQESIEGARAIYREMGLQAPADLAKRRVKVAPISEQVGTTAGAKADTNYIAQARTKLGSKATIHDIIAEAQRLKDAAKPK